MSQTVGTTFTHTEFFCLHSFAEGFETTTFLFLYQFNSIILVCKYMTAYKQIIKLYSLSQQM